ncbi:MAG: histidinol-phosphatase [Candidatus Izemoplasmatales bacterium]|nr:histidinol-phosphatase [Candidatus Izemoplasmatales bacterium]
MSATIDYCYHTHTYRCGHAVGRDEDYVINAIKSGIKVLGFSDHIFYPGIKQYGSRGNYEELEGYVNSISDLKDQYADKILIHLGFEAEYYRDFDYYYKELLRTGIVDYLILAQHYRYEHGRLTHYYGHSRTQEDIREYGRELIKGMETKLFKYVAHPDLFMASYPYGFDEAAKEVSEAICQAAIRLDMPLELNMGAIRFAGQRLIGNEYRYMYPYIPFWETAKRYGVKVIVGIDAHDPRDFLDSRIAIMTDLVEKLDLKHINRLDI